MVQPHHMMGKYLSYNSDPNALWEVPVTFSEELYVRPPEKVTGQLMPVFPSPMHLWRACRAYLRWCVDNPRFETKFFHHEGVGKTHKVNLARIPSVNGLAAFLGVSHVSINNWSNPTAKDHVPRFKPVMDHFREVMTEEKFSGAAVGIYNAGFVSRDLGMMDHTHFTGSTTQTATVHTLDETPAEHLAVHIHPDDPDPLNPPRPLYSRAQLEAGSPFAPLPLTCPNLKKETTKSNALRHKR